MTHGDREPTDKERDDYERAEAIFGGTEPDFSYNPDDDKHGMGDYVQITYRDGTQVEDHGKGLHVHEKRRP